MWRVIRKQFAMFFALACQLLFVLAVVLFFVTHNDAILPIHARSGEPTSPSLLRSLKHGRRDRENLPLCPDPDLTSDTAVPVNVTPVTYTEVSQKAKALGVRHGGRYAPKGCKAREKTAVIIPYRDRRKNLLILLHNLIPFLVKQNMDFRIFVVEQVSQYEFNKGVLLNIGAHEAVFQDDFDCFVFHDTDFLPSDHRNLYRCGPQPRHLVVDRSDLTLRGLAYPRYFGGAIVASTRQWQSINGASNLYWAWGAEDDDIYFRFLAEGYVVERYPFTVGAYIALGHSKQQRSEPSRRKQLLDNSTRRMWADGLNTVKYELFAHLPQAIYTWYLIQPRTPPPSTPTPPTPSPSPLPQTPSPQPKMLTPMQHQTLPAQQPKQQTPIPQLKQQTPLPQSSTPKQPTPPPPPPQPAPPIQQTSPPPPQPASPKQQTSPPPSQAPPPTSSITTSSSSSSSSP